MRGLAKSGKEVAAVVLWEALLLKQLAAGLAWLDEALAAATDNTTEFTMVLDEDETCQGT